MDKVESVTTEPEVMKSAFGNYFQVAITMLRRHWLTVVATTGLGAVIAIVYSVMQEPVYEAKAELLVKFGREYVYRPEVEGLDGWQPSRMIELVNGEVRILNSQNVKLAVLKKIGSLRLYPGAAPGFFDSNLSLSNLKKFDLSALTNVFSSDSQTKEDSSRGEEPKDAEFEVINQFNRDLNIRALGDSSVILVSYKHTDPQLAQEVLTTLLDIYRDRRMEVFSGSSITAAVSLYEQATSEFEKSQNNLANFLESHRPELAAPKLQASSEFAARLYETHLETNATLAKQRIALAKVSDELQAIGANPQAKDGTRTAEIRTVENRLESLLRDSLVINQVADRGSPATIALRQREAELSSQMLEAYLPKKMRDDVSRQEALTLFAAKLALKKEVLAAEQEKEHTGQILSELRSEVASIERDRQKLDLLQGAVDIARERFESARRYLQQAREISLLNSIDSGSVAIIDAPVIPRDTLGISGITRVLIAMVVGAIAGIGLATLLEVSPPVMASSKE
jgi:uncharacterized protein involved in exopolysaccharide biosynthesis